MKSLRLTAFVFSLVVLTGAVAVAETDKVEEALAEVRDVKADLFSRQSSVLGTLPGPAEMAAHQLRCRSIPKPKAGVPREIQFDEATKKRAAGLDPMEQRKAAGRLQQTVLPLGITGAYVTEAQNRVELLVVQVLNDAPATGVLQVDDIIIGANGRLIEDKEDPRPEMGHALVESQSPELRAFLNDYIAKAEKAPSTPADHLKYAKDMLAAHDRLEKHAAATLAIIKKNIDDGMIPLAKTQLDMLAKMLGEERPQAAELRKLAAESKTPAVKRQPPKLLLDGGAIATLGLAGGGIRDGFAHSPQYIARTNQRGFQGMKPEQIAGYLAHFSGGAADGASLALAERGEEVVPLLKQLLGDKHHGIRAGALATLTKIYRSDDHEYKTEVPKEQAEIIKLVRPLIEDPSPLVRAEASGLIQSMKVLNDDVFEVLLVAANQEGNNIVNIARHGIKDPAMRTRLSMALMDTENRCRSKAPDRYGAIFIPATAHLDLCEPYLQTAIDTLNNPEVLNTYGFFSNVPPHGALLMLDRYARNPLVLKHLPDILRFSTRKQTSPHDFFWYPCVEYAHRIVMGIGPKALPVVDAFIKSEAAHFKQIEAGQVERPVWWKETTPEYFTNWRRQMEDTGQLVRALAGEKPPEEVIATMCKVYLANRGFGTWERQQIRDHVSDLGVDVVPVLRRTVAAQASSLRTEFDKQIAAKQAQAEADPKKKGALDREIKQVEAQKTNLDERAEELTELASRMEIFAKDQATQADVKALCRFYVKEAWGVGHAWEVESKACYIRGLYDKQLALTRDTLQRWGKPAVPTIRAFLEDDKPALAKALTELDEYEAHWKKQWSRAAMWPLNQIPMRREDLPGVRAELADLATLIDCAGRDDLSKEQIGTLCRIYTRRGWTSQMAVIEAMLKRNRAAAVPVIQEHLRSEKTALSAAEARIKGLMVNTVRQRVVLHYDRARTAEANLRQGIEGLQTIARTISD